MNKLVVQYILSSPDQSLHSPSNQSLAVKGRFMGQVQYGGMTTKQSCYVVTDLSKPLLGRPAIEQLNLLARVQEIQETPSPIHNYLKLFTGLGKLPGHYHIKLKEGDKSNSLIATGGNSQDPGANRLVLRNGLSA